MTLSPRDALEGKGPRRRSQRRLGRRLEEIAKAVGGGYCRLQIPLRLELGVRETVAGHRLGALEGGNLPPFQCIPVQPPPPQKKLTVPKSQPPLGGAGSCIDATETRVPSGLVWWQGWAACITGASRSQASVAESGGGHDVRV